MSKAKKIGKNIIFILTVVVLICSVTLVVLSTIAKKNNKLLPIFGYSYSVVASPSMEPDLPVGEIIIIKKLNFEKYLETAEDKIGIDAVVYRSERNIYIVHQLYAIENGELILKGTNNPSPDTERVNSENFHGIVVKHGGAWFGSFLLGSRSLIFLVIVLFLIFIMATEIIPHIIKKQSKEESKLDEETRLAIEKEVREEIEKGKNV